MIVLILIAISFVLAPAIQAFVGQGTSNGIVFGKYGKEEIKYAYGNYFYDQVQNYANEYSGSEANQTQALYQIWKSAYDSTVLFTAINQLASKAGITAADEVVKRAIIESGAYDKDGKFDVKTYQEASAETKASVEKSIRRGLPYQIVIDDVGTYFLPHLKSITLLKWLVTEGLSAILASILPCILMSLLHSMHCRTSNSSTAWT